jgi:DNA ligase (NAD+)
MTRDEARQAIRAQGGRSTDSVSANTDFLVVGSDPGERKLAEAGEHATKRLTEQQFRALADC